MSEIQKPEGDGQPNTVKRGFSIEQLSMLMSKMQNKEGLDLSLLSKEQREKVVEIMLQNENHSFEYAKEHLRVTETLNKKALDVSIFNQKTLRIVLIVILAAVFALFILVLIFAKEHIGELVSLLAGLVGGYGLRGGLNDLVKKTPTFHVDSNEPSLPKPR